MLAPNDLAAILAETEAANQAWVNGQWDRGYGDLISSAEDAAIFGPFGGPALIGAQNWAQRAGKAVGQFSNGVSKLKLIAHYTSGDLLVLVLIEEQAADIAGRQSQPWSLRVTQVYRRENGAWKVAHRHADPLVGARSIEQALALAANIGDGEA